MKATVVIWKDKHSDTSGHVFSDREKALEWAEAKAHEYDRFGDFERTEYGNTTVFTYSSEGDGLTVEDVEIDKEIQ